MAIMGNGSGNFRRAFRAGEPAGAGNWLHRRRGAIDGDFGFRLIVVMAGMLSTVAFAFGLLPL